MFAVKFEDNTLTMTTILVVDDCYSIAYLVRLMLERRGCQVIIGCNGHEGLALLDQQAFDLIISNYMMPHMDGLTFLRRLRQRADGARIPFVLMTASARAGVRQAALDSGADAFLPKPFSWKELDAILNRLGIHPSPH